MVVEEHKEPEPKVEKEKAKKDSKTGKKEAKGKGKKKEPEPEPVVEEPPEPELPTIPEHLWDQYLHHLDETICRKVIHAAEISLRFFVTEMNQNENIYPLFELLLTLSEPVIRFIPTLDMEEDFHFFKMVADLQEDINKIGEVMPRILKNVYMDNYYNDVVDDPDCMEMVSLTLTRLNEGIDACYEYIKKFEPYSYLWLENRHEYLNHFLTYGRALTPDELDILKMDGGPGVKECHPTIKQFKEQIDFYEDLYRKLESLDTEMILSKWLKVDVKPLRQAILNTVCKWGNLFKQHLVERVTNSLEELDNFIVESVQAMQVELAEDDYDGLLKVMSYLQKVKDRQDYTDSMFDPLKEIIELLKNYGVEFSEEIHVQLQELPDKWNNCKKVTLLHKLHSSSIYLMLFSGCFNDQTSCGTTPSEPNERHQETNSALGHSTESVPTRVQKTAHLPLGLPKRLQKTGQMQRGAAQLRERDNQDERTGRTVRTDHSRI